MPFDEYAQYYDALYADKDYDLETVYVDSLIRSVTPDAQDMLDLGCGTGAHARHFADRGYRVEGIDLAASQIDMARAKNVSNDRASNQVAYHVGDIRNVRRGKKFDAVVSLFHVISYQTDNQDIIAAFKTAGAHLNASGVFIFDFWYGPAVLNLKPETRIKRVSTESADITRLAEPVCLTHQNIVEVHYELLIRDKQNEKLKQVREKHRMRYLFLPEIEHYLQICGLRLIRAEQWLIGDAVSETTWNGCVVAAPGEM